MTDYFGDPPFILFIGYYVFLVVFTIISEGMGYKTCFMEINECDSDISLLVLFVSSIIFFVLIGSQIGSIYGKFKNRKKAQLGL